ncbi:FliH/SctL family protein [Parvibaculum sp.]|jgi:flagellar assembly protein FliH|uniref:FliH/SctL family protein n=1 Tax=Parvibaculum sp. TaxID=2024848 RepID=UPI001B1119F2|nr:FliH/SctL family protein [Parvibaculum sp.]MBO6634957.1 hypothetical protein [Parvibaculum sp.]MBO6679561.1 hypothetical protein [Parvibaculum sp.]MBO6686646.1 hypothetical protein [Parvibaculum sp.]MBO6905312.1 hypothetical protein [Parvibaculum sp.]
MKQAVKFTFDTHFGEKPTHSAAETNSSNGLTDADLETARERGYADGHAAGMQEAAARSERELETAMTQLATSAASLLSALDGHMASITKESLAVALEASRKLAPAMIATRPEAEIEAVLRDCLTHLNREPHILLRVSASLVDRLKENVDRMAMERGLSGRIILLGEPGLTEGDCVVEWADGGVVRNHDEIEQEIGDIVARYVETLSASKADRNALAMPEPNSPADRQKQ